MASANEPVQTQTEPTGQTSAQGQAAGNGGARSGQSVSSRESGKSPTQAGESPAAGRAVGRSPRQELMGEPGNPFELMWNLSRQMDRMMSSMFRSFGSGSWGSSFPSLAFGAGGESGFMPRPWSPRIDVEQRGDAVRVCADLPGVRKEDVTIDLTEEGLTIAGERREEREEGGEEQGYRSVERSYGRFLRTVPLPKGVDTKQLKAQMREGVLEITIPLDESARPRRIPIQG